MDFLNSEYLTLEEDVDMLKPTKTLSGSSAQFPPLDFSLDNLEGQGLDPFMNMSSDDSTDFLVPSCDVPDAQPGNVNNNVEFGLGDDLNSILVDHSTDVNLNVSYSADNLAAAPKFAEDIMHIKKETGGDEGFPTGVIKYQSGFPSDSRTGSSSSFGDDDDSAMDTSDSMGSPVVPAMRPVLTPDVKPSVRDSMALRARRTLRAPAHIKEYIKTEASSVVPTASPSPSRRSARPGSTSIRYKAPPVSASMARKSRKQRPMVLNADDLKLPGITQKDANAIGKLFPGNALQLDRDGFKEWRRQNKVRKLTAAEDDALRKIRRRLLGRTYAKRSRERQLENETAAIEEVKQLEKENASLRLSIERMERKIRLAMKRN